MTDTTAVTAGSIKGSQARLLRIVIPGGEGHLGRLLARHFSDLRHQVTTLTRNPVRPAASYSGRELPDNSKPWNTMIWDGCSAGAWTEVLEDADVLINLAGRNVNCRYNARNRAAILESRVRSSAILGQVIQKLRRPPAVWLNSSTATIYRHSFDRAMDEATGEIGGGELDAPASWRFSIEVARRWEQAFFDSQTPSARKVALRTAMVMSPAPGGIFEVVSRHVRIGLGGAWGTGRQYMSWIHEQDFVRAIEYLIAHEELAGTVNLAAPVPLTNAAFMCALREAWGTSLGLPSPRWMLEVGAVFLRTETELLLKSRRVIPGRLLESGFRFQFPAWPMAAADLVQRWKIGASQKLISARAEVREESRERAS